MSGEEEISKLLELLATHRSTLHHLLLQAAQHGGVAFTPPQTAHGIAYARAEIRRIKAILCAEGMLVDDRPGDEDVLTAGTTTSAISSKARMGLDALADMVGVPAVREAVTIYLANFESACRQIAILGDYKELHDLLQQLEDLQATLTRFSRPLLTNIAVWDDVEDNEPDLYDKTDELLDFTRSVPFANETALWTPKLTRAQQDVRASVKDRDAGRLKDALGRLKDVIDRQLSRINTRMVGVAAALDLARLVAALRTICDHFVEIMPDVAQQRLDFFRQGLDALVALDVQLTHSIALHTAFQELDDDLRRVEGMLDHDLEELVDAWQDLGPMTRALCEEWEVEWSMRLRLLSTDVERTLLAADLPKLRHVFRRYRSLATHCFNRVDHDLRTLCQGLQQVGAPLDRVLWVLR
jgi:hypothetical protein